MKFKSKASRDGYVFGRICRLIGLLGVFLFLPFLPNEDTLYTKQFVIPSVVSLLLFLYGFWRTGGYDD